MPDPQGLTFDPVAEDYDRGRPGWPPAMVERIDGESVLDLVPYRLSLAARTVRATRL